MWLMKSILQTPTEQQALFLLAPKVRQIVAPGEAAGEPGVCEKKDESPSGATE